MTRRFAGIFFEMILSELAGHYPDITLDLFLFLSRFDMSWC